MPKPRKPRKTRASTRRERHAKIMRQITEERARHAAKNREMARAIDAAKQIGDHTAVSDLYARRGAEHARHMAAMAKLEKRGREI